MILLAKNISLSTLIFCFLSCGNSNEQRTGDANHSVNDSFYSLCHDFEFDTKKIVPPTDFAFDTLTMVQARPYFKEISILPRSISKTDSIQEEIIRKELIMLKGDFMKADSTSGDWKSAKEVDSFEIRMSPVNVFRNNHTVSYSFEICYTDNKSARPYCDNIVLNYDTQKNKLIHFAGYFSIGSANDSVTFKKLILQSLEEEDGAERINFAIQKFSFDKEYVYFFFETGQFSPFNTCGGIKKKYLSKFIKEGYQ